MVAAGTGVCPAGAAGHELSQKEAEDRLRAKVEIPLLVDLLIGVLFLDINTPVCFSVCTFNQ